MSHAMRNAFCAVFAGCAWCFSQDATVQKEEKPAIELGGYVTVDYATDLANAATPSFGIGEVDLSANVNISPEVVASITVMTYDKLDSMWIDQAMVAWTPSRLPVEFLFGQQTMNHGLLTTRMISDPLIIDHVEKIHPTVILNGTMDRFTGGFGFTVLPETDVYGTTAYLYSVVLNVDVNLFNESIMRLSSFANTSLMDIDLAGTLNWAPFAIDFEALVGSAGEGDSVPSGFYAGVLWEPTDRLGFALRGDGYSFADGMFKDMDLRFGAGVTVKLKDGIFCAAEFGRTLSGERKGTNEIRIEVGLEQTIQLPGFQRKTLTRDYVRSAP